MIEFNEQEYAKLIEQISEIPAKYSFNILMGLIKKQKEMVEKEQPNNMVAELIKGEK